MPDRLSKRRDLAREIEQLAAGERTPSGPSSAVTVDSLQSQISALEAQLAALKSDVDAHKAQKAGQAHK